MTTLADQLATVWAASDPTAQSMCLHCGKRFSIVGPAGIPSMTCPHCGFVPSEDCCRSCLSAVQSRGKSSPVVVVEPVKDEPEVRDDPPGLYDVIGNAAAVLQIRTALDAHRARLGKVDGRTQAARALAFPHMLIAGPGGTGKTMLAEIIAREIKRPIRLQMGQSINSPARVADMLLSLKGGDVLFIDELHGMRPAAQETLYRAMEDGLLVPIAKAGKPPAPPIRLPAFTFIGASTDEWALLPSLLQRFKYRVRLERMSAADLAQSISQRAERRGWSLTAEAAGMIADRAHGTPRLALGLLDGCMDCALAGGETAIDAMIVQSTCEIWSLDAMGLDKIERKYLSLLESAGGPVRVNVLASQLDNLSRRTLEMKIEPTLIWAGLIEKRSDGRALTSAGRQHLKGAK